jgi:hypothetical protein
MDDTDTVATAVVCGTNGCFELPAGLSKVVPAGTGEEPRTCPSWGPYYDAYKDEGVKYGIRRCQLYEVYCDEERCIKEPLATSRQPVGGLIPSYTNCPDGYYPKGAECFNGFCYRTCRHHSYGPKTVKCGKEVCGETDSNRPTCSLVDAMIPCPGGYHQTKLDGWLCKLRMCERS